jgi:hypothetical protein
MENIFVPYKESLELKELGFNDGCLAVYRRGSLYGSGTSVNRYYEDGHWQLEKNSDYGGAIKSWVAAPTFSQVFTFFREKYKLHVYIDFYHSENYFYKIKSQDGRSIGNTGDIILQGSPVFTRTYEESELECLRKLIEIIKNAQPISFETEV